MKKYGLHGKLRATPGKGDELASILSQASALMASANGCYLYMVSIDAQDVDTVWVTEVWESKEDHDNSLGIAGVSELISKAIPILEGKPGKGLELQVISGI